MSKGLWSLGFVLLVPNLAAASAFAITTSQSGISQVEVANVRQVESSDAKTDGSVSVFAIYGTLTTPEARTAARSSSAGMAANARIDDKRQFSGTNFSTVLSQASYALTLGADNLFVNDAILDFVLPFSYLEVTSNSETPQVTLDTVILADLRVCFAVACTLSDTVFHLQGNLEASWQNFNWAASVTGDPQLDLTPLQNPTIVDNGRSGFLRTTTIEFPMFQGHLDLGTIPVGSPLTVEYIMQARANGVLRANIAIAAINDPFLLETDPIQSFAPLTLTLTPQDDPSEPPTSPVPEPASMLLCATGLAACRRRRRQTVSRQ